MNVKLESSVTFDFITSSFSTGAAADADSTPSFEVFEDATDTALTLSTSSIAKRTGKTGNYRATFTVAAADGFEAGKSYNVVASATVSSVAGKGVIGRFVAHAKDVDGVGLADDSIKASTFDESTAYPLKSADTGSTQVARVGADGDTLETLSDQLDAKASQSSVDDIPTNSELSTALAGLASTLTTIQGYVDELETRLSAARAGFLDKLNVSGTLAHSDAAATYKADVSAVALEATAQALKVVLDKLATMLEQDGGVYRYNSNALEQAPSGSGASPEDIADAVCDEVLSGHTTPGSLGAAIAAAGTAGDPWIGDLSGYVEGQAGYELHHLHEQVMDVLPDYPSIDVPAPPTAEQSTAWIRCLDEHGAPEGGVTIQVRLIRADDGVDAYDTAIVSAVSAAGTGLWSQTILRGSGFVYEARRGTNGRWVRFRSANAPTVLLPAVLGQ